MAGQSDITTDTKDSLNEPLENVFDASTVNEELEAQVEITRAFDQERRKIKTELNKKEQELRDEAEQALTTGDEQTAIEKSLAADKVQQKALLFDGISSALYGPNVNGATGYVAKAVSPQVAYQIGQYFKKNDFLNDLDNGSRSQTGSPEHLLAHALLGAAVSAATGNDALTGGLGASTGEGTAILLSKYIYKVDKPSELTAEQKDTISNITTLAGVAIGSTTGEVIDAVNAGETAKVAVENNGMGGDRIGMHYKTNAELAEETRQMSDVEARIIKNTIGIAVFPVGFLDAYYSAKTDKEKLLVLAEIMPLKKAKTLLDSINDYKVAKKAEKATNDTVEKARVENNVNRDNDLLSNKPSGRQEYDPRLETLKKQISPTVAQSQRKHIKGDSQHQHGSYFNNKEEAQGVLDAFHNNKATIVGYNRQNQPIVRYDNGKGTYATNQNGEIKTYKTVYYLIKGTKKVSVVPYSPRGPK